jgi:hypothetical protein
MPGVPQAAVSGNDQVSIFNWADQPVKLPGTENNAGFHNRSSFLGYNQPFSMPFYHSPD